MTPWRLRSDSDEAFTMMIERLGHKRPLQGEDTFYSFSDKTLTAADPTAEFMGVTVGEPPQHRGIELSDSKEITYPYTMDDRSHSREQ